MNANPHQVEDPAALEPATSNGPYTTEVSTRGGDLLAQAYTTEPIPHHVLASWVDSPLDYWGSFSAADNDSFSVYDDANHTPVWNVQVTNAQGEVILAL